MEETLLMMPVVICFQTLDLRSLITTNKLLPEETESYVVICFQTLDLRSLITTVQTNKQCSSRSL